VTYIITCDWCGKHIGNETDCASLPVTVKRHGSGSRRPNLGAGRDWGQETLPTLFFCVSSDGRDARDRMGLAAPRESPGGCFERAMDAIRGTPTETPDMGMEWRLVAVGAADTDGRAHGNRPPAPVPVAADADLAAYLDTLAPSARACLVRALHGAGISTLEQIEAASDDDLMAINGISWNTRCKLRAFQAERAAARAADAPVTTHGES
jgi:hypothetical protein